MAITREYLEEKQIGIYIATIILTTVIGLNWENSSILEWGIEPVIAVLLYSMFCQIPFLSLKNALRNRSFFKALLFGNFILIPLLVWALISVFPTHPIITLGVCLVLLTPCIDYVIVFAHLGKGNAKALLAATPLLFIFQMLLLPLYLWGLVGETAFGIIEITPFLRAFVFMIALPFLLSIVTQRMSKSNHRVGRAIHRFSSWLPVPLMAMTFFVVIGSHVGLLMDNREEFVTVIPIYVTFAVVAPFIGRIASRIFQVDTYGSRAIVFSTGTRNSLVVLPLAFSLPAPENQLVAVIIVTQTIVEILVELFYIKLIPFLVRDNT